MPSVRGAEKAVHIAASRRRADGSLSGEVEVSIRMRMKRSVISATYLAMVSSPGDPSTRERSAGQVA